MINEAYLNPQSKKTYHLRNMYRAPSADGKFQSNGALVFGGQTMKVYYKFPPWQIYGANSLSTSKRNLQETTPSSPYNQANVDFNPTPYIPGKTIVWAKLDGYTSFTSEECPPQFAARLIAKQQTACTHCRELKEISQAGEWDYDHAISICDNFQLGISQKPIINRQNQEKETKKKTGDWFIDLIQGDLTGFWILIALVIGITIIIGSCQFYIKKGDEKINEEMKQRHQRTFERKQKEEQQKQDDAEQNKFVQEIVGEQIRRASQYSMRVRRDTLNAKRMSFNDNGNIDVQPTDVDKSEGEFQLQHLEKNGDQLTDIKESIESPFPN